MNKRKNYTHLIPFDLRLAVRAKVEECIDTGQNIWGMETSNLSAWDMTEIRYDLAGRTAGYAHSYYNYIRLNADLLVRYGERFIERTVVHEMAHIITGWVYGHDVAPHGEEWKHVMRRLGAKDISRCHRYKTKPVRKVKRYAASCACSPHQLSSVRVNKMKKGVVYRCLDCKTPVTLDRPVSRDR